MGLRGGWGACSLKLITILMDKINQTPANKRNHSEVLNLLSSDTDVEPNYKPQPKTDSNIQEKRGKNLEKVINELCLLNDKSNSYLHLASGIYSAIDLSQCDPSMFMDYDWKVLDSWGCNHFPIILTNSKEIENHPP